MSDTYTSVFQNALDMVESLPEYQREDLISIVKKRLIEQRRDAIATNIKNARDELSKGEVKKGSVSDLMKELL